MIWGEGMASNKDLADAIEAGLKKLAKDSALKAILNHQAQVNRF